jgi:hypothetical protein
MTGKAFILEPHPETVAAPAVRITGAVSIQINTIFVHFQMEGRVGEVRLPPFSRIPVRMDRLWEETCFEFFIGTKGSRRYWEFNLSPSGDWNVYRFSDYRESMHEETAVTRLPIRDQRGADVFLLSAECELEKILPPGEGMDVGISAVIRSEAGGLSYWAMVHPGERPDFHRREGLLIEL